MPVTVTVTMPRLGESVREGTILAWMRRVGDTVVEDEPLVEISADKVDVEMPSPVSGTILEILAAAGETVAVGAPIAVVGDPAVPPDPTVRLRGRRAARGRERGVR